MKVGLLFTAAQLRGKINASQKMSSCEREVETGKQAEPHAVSGRPEYFFYLIYLSGPVASYGI